MLKKHFLALLAAGLIAITGTLAAAQSSSGQSSNDGAANNQSSPQGKGEWHHGMPDPAQRTAELTKKLNLTSDQQSKVQDIFQSERSTMESLRQDSSLSQQDRRGKMMDARKSSDTQVRALLDSTQQKKWDEMQAKREQWAQKNHPPDNGGQTPPPQQE